MTQPKRIGPYLVLKEMDQGGMGTVFQAMHVETAERVALKTVRSTRAGNLWSIRREIHALSRLAHPGIVRIVGRHGSGDSVVRNAALGRDHPAPLHQRADGGKRRCNRDAGAA